MGNHLGSASLELDGEGRIISYEEYFPYGSTSYQAVRTDIEVPAKRYRYTGMERDEESGLSYHGARYYAPWLGRWVNPEILLQVKHLVSKEADVLRRSTTQPGNNSFKAAFLPADLNPYLFVLNNPIIYTDPNGESPVKIGDVYIISGTINGKEVVYTGSTARELKARFSNHEWKSLIQDPKTTIYRAEIRGELNVALSNRENLRSARNEALRSAEQVVLKRRRADTQRAGAGEPLRGVQIKGKREES